MTSKKIPFYRRIIFWLLVPVITTGLVCSTILVATMTNPIQSFLVKQFDANLRLSSMMGLKACQESFHYLLDLRLEKNIEMNQVMQNEVIEEIKSISSQFPHIHLMVLKSGESIEAWSLQDPPKKGEGPSVEGLDDQELVFDLRGQAARSHVQFFPFWDWQIVSFVFEDDFKGPIRMAYTATYLSAAGVLLAVIVTLVLVFCLFVNKPLNRLITATDGVSDGRLFKIDTIARNELGRLTVSFNGMIESLEREKAEVLSLIHQLKESEALFRSQFEFGNIGIAITTADKRWIRANERLCSMLGYSEGELQQKTWPELTHPEDLEDDRANHDRMVEGKIESYEMDARLVHKSGQIVSVHLNVSCFRNPDRSVRFVISSLLDTTEQRQAEQERQKLEKQLVQSQKLESIGRLAGGVAHDLNNLLAPVIGYAEMLSIESSEKDPRRDRIEQIKKAGLRARDLVNQLLAFSRKQTLEYAALDLNQTIKEFEPLLRRTIREDIRITILPSPGLPTVMADVGQIEQVILNLAVNAADAMSGGGTLTIETASTTLDQEYAHAHTAVKPGQYVMLAISDTGQGMDEETLAQIFEPFFTTKGELGTGLGLATVYGIIKQHGGNIWVYSEPGKGTTFKVYLPVSDEKNVERRIENPTMSHWEGSETILLAEDNDQVRDLARAILEQQGYVVIAAKNGEEALEKSESYEGPIHLLLTDVIMPEMNGKQLFEKVSSSYPDLVVLYMSGYTDDVIARHGVLEQGVNYLQKPFSFEALASKVRQVLNG